jgi:hypothetical protein
MLNKNVIMDKKEQRSGQRAQDHRLKKKLSGSFSESTGKSEYTENKNMTG